MAGLVLASQQGRLSADFVSGYGFAGIIIAFLARNNPITVALVSFLIAMLFDAGRSLQVFNQIPFSMVQLIGESNEQRARSDSNDPIAGNVASAASEFSPTARSRNPNQVCVSNAVTSAKMGTRVYTTRS
jgi:hypothetical protein